MKLLNRLFFLLLISSSCIGISLAQEGQSITLNTTPLQYKPTQFSIALIIDDRKEVNTIGSLYNTSNKQYLINLEHGAAIAIQQYLDNALEQAPSKQKINLHISQFAITQKGYGKQLTLDYGFVFYEGDNRLIEYTGKITAQTANNVHDFVAQMIRRALEKSLNDFDNWQQSSNGNSTTGNLKIKPEVVIGKNSKDKDIIVFSKKPLVWDNFTGSADAQSPADAATFSGFAMSLSLNSNGRQTAATVTITPVFYKSRSWYKPSGKNAYALAHEQLHFNISGIIACALAADISSREFDIKTIKNDIEQLQKKYTEKQNLMQQQYDEETEHGILHEQQAVWQQKIDTMLSNISCY